MNAEEKASILHLLQKGTLELEGHLPWSSNYTFLARVCGDAVALPVVYKPRRGERPLWDFPRGTLCQRERAAFLVSDALGWEIVPPTVLRRGQHGFGSVQLFIEHDPDRHYFTFEGDPLYRAQLQKMVLLDVIINNADRKAGHVLVEQENGVGETAVGQTSEHLWGIDHGICFHADYKLRTVIWEFAGMCIPEEMQHTLARFGRQFADHRSQIHEQLHALLTRQELDALEARLERLLKTGVFPNPGPGRHYPWPPV